MRRTETMTAGGVTLAGLGVLAGLAIGSGEGNPATVASRTQPVEVRTEVIRKTVHVYRRDHPHRTAGGGGRGASPGPHGSRAGVAAAGVARTRSSGAGTAGRTPAGSAPPIVRTRASGSGTAAPVRNSAPSSRPVRTASSGTHSSSGATHSSGGTHRVSASRPVSTRTSGASHPSSGSAAPVKTRTSGHGDGGDGGGHDN